MVLVYLKRIWGWIRRNWYEITGAFLGTVLLVLLGVFLTFGNPYHSQPDELGSVMNDEEVQVEEYKGGFVMSPRNSTETALIFYPGGRVHPDAYLYTLAPLVEERDVKVFVPKMTLNLAVLDIGKAGSIIEENPGIENWYVGGHSLGGAMSCRYASNNAEKVEGIVLFASYCADDVSNSSLDVLAVKGTNDAVLNRDKFEENKKYLPDGARIKSVEGLNHSQFGSYTGQPGDSDSDISYEEARNRLTEILLDWYSASLTSVLTYSSLLSP